MVPDPRRWALEGTRPVCPAGCTQHRRVMSVKIYDGFRWDAPEPQACAFELADQLRAVLAPRLERLAFAAVVARATELFDGAAAPLEKGRSPLAAARSEFLDAAREVASTGRRRPLYDFTCDVWLLRHPTDRAALLAKVVCEHDVADALAAVPGFAPWPYWDNTEGPEDVTDGEWRARGDTWVAAWGPGPLGRHALRVELGDPVPHLCFGDLDAIMAAVPPAERRARTVLEREVADGVDVPEGASATEVIAAFSEQLDAALADPDRLGRIEERLVALTAAQLTGAVR